MQDFSKLKNKPLVIINVIEWNINLMAFLKLKLKFLFNLISMQTKRLKKKTESKVLKNKK